MDGEIKILTKNKKPSGFPERVKIKKKAILLKHKPSNEYPYTF